MKKQRFILPRNVKYIISELNNCGHRAGIVGGSVRDILLGKEPSDYDITTSASPDEMKMVFSKHKTVETGIKHGTLTILLDGEPYEVTTYRLDGEYTDNRHPDKVLFTKDVKLDLARRDFTVNAMTYNDDDGFLDLFGGIPDLEKGIIRAVGDPEKRFSEDALRILRALRFASTLDFEIEGHTAAAIRRCVGLVLNVSAERLFSEWKKLIGGKGAYRILRQYQDVILTVIPGLKQLYLPDENLFLSADAELRELSLFAPLPSCVSSYDGAMRSMRCDNKRRLFGIAVLENISLDLAEREDIIRSLVDNGREVTEAVIRLQVILEKTSPDTLDEFFSIISSGACFKLSDLAVNGEDLIRVGISGKAVGDELKRILLMVAMGNLANTREEIEKEVSIIKK